MTLFLRLSNRIININTIKTVWHNPKKQVYNIYFITTDQFGMKFSKTCGFFSTTEHKISFDKEKNLDDYTAVDKWYNSFEKQ